jgi:hypothetical protein
LPQVLRISQSRWLLLLTGIVKWIMVTLKILFGAINGGLQPLWRANVMPDASVMLGADLLIVCSGSNQCAELLFLRVIVFD